MAMPQAHGPGGVGARAVPAFISAGILHLPWAPGPGSSICELEAEANARGMEQCPMPHIPPSCKYRYRQNGSGSR